MSKLGQLLVGVGVRLELVVSCKSMSLMLMTVTDELRVASGGGLRNAAWLVVT